MTIIPQELHEKISQNPENSFAVLITLKEESLPMELANKGKFIMGNKIYSANISGKEIQSLLQQQEIEAIEPDEEMGIL